MTKIEYGIKLVADHSKEYAINYFKKRIEQIGEPKCFQDICNISGDEFAIEYIQEHF